MAMPLPSICNPPRFLAPLAIVAVLLMAPALTCAQAVVEFAEPPDLALRHALFAYYNGESLPALARLNDYVADHPQSRALDTLNTLRAKLYLDNRLLSSAESVLQQPHSQTRDNDFRNTLWLDIADIYYHKGLYAKSAEALQQITTRWRDEQQQERWLALQGMLALADNDYASAADLFKELKGRSDWGTYGQYNLGITLLNLGKLDDAIAELDKIGRRDFASEEMRALKDRANIALGFIHLRAQEAAEAQRYLERVRLNAEQSNQALLGLGWVNLSAKEYQAALIPLLELNGRPTYDTAVLEARLAVPYALEHLKSYNNALSYYEGAAALYERQLQEIATLSPQLVGHSETLIALLNNKGSRVRSELQERISAALTTQHWFSATLANYNELSALQQTFKTLEQSEAYRQLKRQPARQAQFAQQITQLNHDIKGALQEHATLLSTVFIAELNKESQKLNRYLNQARFAMAQIYETLMSQRIDTP